ncbi:D-alanyl-lipoteichoic acid biosynthesis protein DltD [Lapidilactobacillus luobeiensis]|uniref:D-alanyl-lipoteichoic acid biosynthesis protein DltD n=1 Tax=Lapidilactobacillus luobeiensis TaxID=2950371 RepID=UPI0021C3CE2B|nr:D-alanyl-lipoteichoic acid biosynthesis protein DltD [Lapidilactobacillus luobeiensis]
MKAGKQLWRTFGPVLVAVLAALALFATPWRGLKISSQTVKEAAVSLSNNVYRGEKIKDVAVKDNYVPFIGSSELSRMDALHPSVLAAKYQRGYQTLLLGGPGSQSLNHYFTIQEMRTQLRNKKIVYVISPQWFTPQGQRADAFGYYYSALQAADWLLQAKNTKADRYAAKRLLTMPSGTSSLLIETATKKIAAGRPLLMVEKLMLTQKQIILKNEDALFSTIDLDNNWQHIQNEAKKLPATDNNKLLDQVATTQARQETKDNQFDIKDSFFKKELRGGRRLPRLKDSQTRFDYRRSPEYADFQLVLQQLAALNCQVEFVLPPINQRWVDYTGLNMTMWRQTTKKIKQQLTSQGFTNIDDLSEDGNQSYYMEDTIHIGWRGWLRMDQSVKPFLTKQQAQPDYQINDYYLSQAWQQKIVK